MGWTNAYHAPTDTGKPTCAFCGVEIVTLPATALFTGDFTCGQHPAEQAAGDEMRARSRLLFVADHPRFDLHGPCPKCGNEHRTTEYHAGRHTLSPWSRHYFCWLEIWPHMLRTCDVCQHESIEVPLDLEAAGL
jgi:hypothetical protein